MRKLVLTCLPHLLTGFCYMKPCLPKPLFPAFENFSCFCFRVFPHILLLPCFPVKRRTILELRMFFIQVVGFSLKWTKHPQGQSRELYFLLWRHCLFWYSEALSSIRNLSYCFKREYQTIFFPFPRLTDGILSFATARLCPHTLLCGCKCWRVMERTLHEADKEEVSRCFNYEMTVVKLCVAFHSQCLLTSPSYRYNIMKSCWQWNATNRPSPADLIRSLQAAIKTSNNHAVLQVPEFVVPELYANVAGVDVLSLVSEYTILWRTLSHVGEGEVSEFALSRLFSSSEWGVYVWRDPFVFQTCCIYIRSLLHAWNNKLLPWLLLLNQPVDITLPVVIWEQSGFRKLQKM